jgi:Tol biopolymer transport system component/DNA-binding CsgD family transcriptional regulator
VTTIGRTTSTPERLTPRQREVLELLRRGDTNEEIARSLGISLDGAKWHVSEIIGRLGVADRYEAARWRPEGERRPWWSLAWFRDLSWPTAAKAASVAALAIVTIAIIALAWGVWRAYDDHYQTAAVSLTPSRSVVSRGTFEDVRGWIAFRSRGNLLAVDPANPANRVSLAPSGADPIGWSADGTRLLLQTTDDDTFSLDGFPVVLNSDGARTVLRKATWGSFSPDGTKVVYATNGRCPESLSPYIIDADGGEPRSLGAPSSPRSCGEGLAEWAAWAPDGSRIAFVDFWEDHPAYGGHAYTLSFLDPDTGATLGDVINVAAEAPAWSPDGSKLAFFAVVLDEDADPSNASLGPGGDFPAQIFVINADGSGLRQLTHEGDNRWPTWSPDGSRIAFAKGQLTLTTASDGSQAAFVPPGSRQLFTMASDGTDVQLVEGVYPEGAIAWNPVP